MLDGTGGPFVCSLTLNEIHLRDPCVLRDESHYVLYGTRGETAWGEADGFDCYISEDLVSWRGPVEIFRRSRSFWADRCYWAPECHLYKGAYYLIATFASGDGRMGVQVLVAKSPRGPFQLHSSGPVTPPDWQSLDGTLYVDRTGSPYLVFSRSFREVSVGEICAVALSNDLKHAVGEVHVLLTGAAAPWVRPFPFAKREFGIEEEAYLADGPFVYASRWGGLFLLWSSFSAHGYAVGIARSATGDLLGPWVHTPEPLVNQDGGHAMVFTTREETLLLAMHAPNTTPLERPVLIELVETNEGLRIKGSAVSTDGTRL